MNCAVATGPSLSSLPQAVIAGGAAMPVDGFAAAIDAVLAMPAAPAGATALPGLPSVALPVDATAATKPEPVRTPIESNTLRAADGSEPLRPAVTSHPAMVLAPAIPPEAGPEAGIETVPTDREPVRRDPRGAEPVDTPPVATAEARVDVPEILPAFDSVTPSVVGGLPAAQTAASTTVMVRSAPQEDADIAPTDRATAPSRRARTPATQGTTTAFAAPASRDGVGTAQDVMMPTLVPTEPDETRPDAALPRRQPANASPALTTADPAAPMIAVPTQATSLAASPTAEPAARSTDPVVRPAVARVAQPPVQPTIHVRSTADSALSETVVAATTRPAALTAPIAAGVGNIRADALPVADTLGDTSGLSQIPVAPVTAMSTASPTAEPTDPAPRPAVTRTVQAPVRPSTVVTATAQRPNVVAPSTPDADHSASDLPAGSDAAVATNRPAASPLATDAFAPATLPVSPTAAMMSAAAMVAPPLDRAGAAAASPAKPDRSDAKRDVIGKTAPLPVGPAVASEAPPTIASPHDRFTLPTTDAAAPAPSAPQAPDVAAPGRATPEPSLPDRGAIAPMPPLEQPMRTVAQTATTPAAPAFAEPVVVARVGQIGQDVGVHIAHRIADGGDELVVRLLPAELGRIEVRMSFDDRGGLRAVIAADSPVALDMLRRDSADLSRSLSDAGVRSDAQSLRFQTDAGSGGSNGQPRSPWLDAEAKYGRGARDGRAADDGAPTPYRTLRTSGRYDLLA